MAVFWTFGLHAMASLAREVAMFILGLLHRFAAIHQNCVVISAIENGQYSL